MEEAESDPCGHPCGYQCNPEPSQRCQGADYRCQMAAGSCKPEVTCDTRRSDKPSNPDSCIPCNPSCPEDLIRIEKVTDENGLFLKRGNRTPKRVIRPKAPFIPQEVPEPSPVENQEDIQIKNCVEDVHDTPFYRMISKRLLEMSNQAPPSKSEGSGSIPACCGQYNREDLIKIKRCIEDDHYYFQSNMPEVNTENLELEPITDWERLNHQEHQLHFSEGHGTTGAPHGPRKSSGAGGHIHVHQAHPDEPPIHYLHGCRFNAKELSKYTRFREVHGNYDLFSGKPTDETFLHLNATKERIAWNMPPGDKLLAQDFAEIEVDFDDICVSDSCEEEEEEVGKNEEKSSTSTVATNKADEVAGEGYPEVSVEDLETTGDNQEIRLETPPPPLTPEGQGHLAAEVAPAKSLKYSVTTKTESVKKAQVTPGAGLVNRKNSSKKQSFVKMRASKGSTQGGKLGESLKDPSQTDNQQVSEMEIAGDDVTQDIDEEEEEEEEDLTAGTQVEAGELLPKENQQDWMFTWTYRGLSWSKTRELNQILLNDARQYYSNFSQWSYADMGPRRKSKLKSSQSRKSQYKTISAYHFRQHYKPSACYDKQSGRRGTQKSDMQASPLIRVSIKDELPPPLSIDYWLVIC